MNKREYKRSTRFATYKEYSKEELDVIIDVIKKTGLIPSGKFVSPNQIEPYLKEHYFQLLRKIDELGVDPKDIRDRMMVDDMKVQFVNLSQPVWLSLVKKFWVGDSFIELQSIVVIKLMEIIKKRTYNPDKASLTSWVYENIYWILLKYFKDEKEYEKKQVSLIDFDQKMNNEQ